MTQSADSAVTNHVLTIAITHAGGQSTLDRQAYAQLTRMLKMAAVNPDVRVVVLRGFNGCFCRGGDLSEFLDTDLHHRLIATVTDLFQTLAEFPKPLIAGVDGDAIGVGCTLLFHCDMVIASEQSTFRAPFVDFGLIPDAATSALAPIQMGYGNAFRFFCLGETFDAATAKSSAIVTDLVESEELIAKTNSVARKLAKKPTFSLSQTRQLLRGDRASLRGQIDREIELFRDALQDEGTMRRLSKIAQLAA